MEKNVGFEVYYFHLFTHVMFYFYLIPYVALLIFDGSLFGLYMTPLFGHLMKGHTGHLFMDIHFILAGALFSM
jgi:putative copper resistance protein D